ncbi:hypothetical protein K7X08_023217 [Anisodus acutangulus]|uniref:Uncharacterized protein n=1 Tax=Anisodus acutangulus TaxID=402998 RepID=A0A9Q1LH79_9SOLA|nr:hypothetical protein K7X08_023217 [Anisodus acutangulus]
MDLTTVTGPQSFKFSIKSSPHVTDEIMCNIASQCPLLRELDISFCYEISHKCLSQIGQRCPNLQTLRRNFINWLDPSQHVRVVPKEYLDACPQDGCTNLEHVDLSGCANVTAREISNASLNLKKLKTMKKPNFYIPRTVVLHTERYGHWKLYDERFQTDVFRI